MCVSVSMCWEGCNEPKFIVVRMRTCAYNCCTWEEDEGGADIQGHLVSKQAQGQPGIQETLSV
jgi:hypothetical protein